MSVAERRLKADGWTVKKVHRENLGYDLLCRRKAARCHVEVKGVAGERSQFIITANELGCWRTEPAFALGLVTRALMTTPRFHLLLGSRGHDRFDFKPLAYTARLRRDEVLAPIAMRKRSGGRQTGLRRGTLPRSR